MGVWVLWLPGWSKSRLQVAVLPPLCALTGVMLTRSDWPRWAAALAGTAAALLLTIVFVGIATSEVAIVKLFGIGLTLAILVDAFLIRATLVPAFMRLAGRSNWWAPRRLRRWHLRYGIWENEPIALLDREFESVT